MSCNNSVFKKVLTEILRWVPEHIWSSNYQLTTVSKSIKFHSGAFLLLQCVLINKLSKKLARLDSRWATKGVTAWTWRGFQRRAIKFRFTLVDLTSRKFPLDLIIILSRKIWFHPEANASIRRHSTKLIKAEPWMEKFVVWTS